MCRVCATARALHLGEVWQPGQNPSRNQGGNIARCRLAPSQTNRCIDLSGRRHRLGSTAGIYSQWIEF